MKTRVAVVWSDRYIYFAFSGHYESLNVYEGEDIAKERWELWNRDVVEVFANPQPERITLSGPAQTLDLHLKIVTQTAQVNVQDNVVAVSTDASSNASATVLTGDDLQSLSDDPEDLQADLEALAGPSAGPGGGILYT